MEMYNPTWTDVQRTINNVRGVRKFGVVKTATQSSANILTLALPCHLYTMVTYVSPLSQLSSLERVHLHRVIREFSPVCVVLGARTWPA
jgi:hypothetical protein